MQMLFHNGINWRMMLTNTDIQVMVPHRENSWLLVGGKRPGPGGKEIGAMGQIHITQAS